MASPDFVGLDIWELDFGPLEPPFEDATGYFERFNASLITITLSDGSMGHALGGTAVANLCLREVLWPVLAGKSLSEWDQIRQDCFWKIRNSGQAGIHKSVLATLETAVLDLRAKQAVLPVFRYLGGQEATVPVYVTAGSLVLSESELQEQCTTYVERGFKLLKIKIGSCRHGRVADDVRRVRAAREAVGQHIELAVDANQALTVDAALAVAQAVAPFAPKFFEEPLHAFDYTGYSTLHRKSPIPIAAGETERLAHGFQTALSLDCWDYWQPCPDNLGFCDMREVMELAAAHDKPLYCGGYTLDTAHVLAAGRGERCVEYLEQIISRLMSVFQGVPQIAGGHIQLTEAPGFGCEPDHRLIDAKCVTHLRDRVP